ncbi:MAG: hypothetical protein ABIT47_00405 [Candidatus Paceibacterota bacterium]
MSRESILMILGVLVAVSPWSGLPLAILVWILPVLGIAIAFIGFTLRTRANSIKEASSRPSQELY